MPVEDVAQYDWAAEDSVFGPGATVSLVAGLGPARALELLAPGGATDVGSAAEVRAWADHVVGPPWASVVEAWTTADWTVLVEDSSGSGATLDGAVESLSVNGRAAVVSSSINADMWFGYAVDGVLVRQFEPLMYDVMGQVGEEEGLAFGQREDRWLQAALLLMERLTGVVLSPDELRGTAPDRLAIGFC
ncbi:hypothetical protein GCU67_15505 [Modestobacter muralis]|uniref:Uncharacterized protein n=1 Tax=Modestobacter muralis TaxID=1608614 RepID=A0A6P0HBS9_9ACTN|nr:hypothetical protein [Modestobacter muralis]NEN52449.1 hypothetical protein [Modestobacter muralis]